jgi:hypothetical protein
MLNFSLFVTNCLYTDNTKKLRKYSGHKETITPNVTDIFYISWQHSITQTAAIQPHKETIQ